jgi:hypothetical protein
MSTPVPDRAVLTVSGRQRELNIAEFLMIDLKEQVNHLFRGEVTFFLGKEQLRTVDALKALRAQRAAMAVGR